MIDRVLAMLPRRRKAFTSAAGAQVWFEWRGKAFFLSAVLALPMILVMMIYPVPTMGHFDPVMTATTYANLPLLALVMAWCLGMTLAKTDYWTRETELSSFVTARPLTDGDIVIAKLKAAALILVTAALLFMALAIPSFNLGYWLNSTDMNWPPGLNSRPRTRNCSCTSATRWSCSPPLPSPGRQWLKALPSACAAKRAS